jgi:Family of unknown function (DUF5313)
MNEDQRRRPDPARWVWYTFGGALGPRYRQWVSHDVTCRARWVRRVARAVVQVAPIGALLILVLGTGWITCSALIGGLVMALIYSAAYIDQSAAHRLSRHGYPRGTAQRIISERDRAKDPDRMRRYMQTYRNQAT